MKMTCYQYPRIMLVFPESSFPNVHDFFDSMTGPAVRGSDAAPANLDPSQRIGHANNKHPEGSEPEEYYVEDGEFYRDDEIVTRQLVSSRMFLGPSL